jgi:hypothetical protein
MESNLLAENRARSGGGLHAESATLTLVNDTVAFNHAKVGGGLALRDSTASITNAIVWGNRAARDSGLHIKSGRVLVNHSDVEGGWAGESNIDSDPGFIDPVHGDYHLPIHSPCRGKGTTDRAHTAAQDFERNPRLPDGRVDLGADEFAPALYRAARDNAAWMRIIGPPGATVVVAVSQNKAPLPGIWAHGDACRLDPPVTRVPWSAIPAGGWVELPLGLPPGVAADGTVHVQAIVGGRLTNSISFPGWRH